MIIVEDLGHKNGIGGGTGYMTTVEGVTIVATYSLVFGNSIVVDYRAVLVVEVGPKKPKLYRV